jgi:hypothetical protein
MLLKIKLNYRLKVKVLRHLSLVLLENVFIFVLSRVLHLILMPCVRMMSVLVVVCMVCTVYELSISVIQPLCS